MPGRRRRAASNSTVATIDQETVRYYKEASVLKPVSSDTHSDDWPCFLLCDATVHRRDGSLVNQLHVDMEGPFVVRGRLELENDNKQCLIHRNMKAKDIWIQIESSHTFSVGAKDDSLAVPVVWANGIAGWFEIIPSKAYRPICDFMFQAVGIHDSFLDQYEAGLERLQNSKRKSKAAPTLADVEIDLDELLFQYALRAGDGLTLPEAYERLHNQAVFILSHFPKETGVARYLANKFPDIVQELAEKIASKMASYNKKRNPTPPATPLIAYDYSPREQSSSSVEALDIVSRKDTVRKKDVVSQKGKGRARTVIPRTTEHGQLLLPDMIIADISRKSHDAQSSRSAKLKRKFLPDTAGEDDDITMLDLPNANSNLPEKSSDQRTGHGEDHMVVDSDSIGGADQQGNVIVEALEDVREQILQLISEGKHRLPLHKITAKNWRLKVFLECNIKTSRCLEEIFLYHARDLTNLLGPEWHNTEIYRWAKENASKQVTLTAISEAEIKQLRRRVKQPTRNSRAEKLPAKLPEKPTEKLKDEEPTEKSIDDWASETPQPEVRSYASKQTPRQTRLTTRAAGLRPSNTGSKKRLRHEYNLEDEVDLDEDESSKKKSKKSHFMAGEDENDNENDNKNAKDNDIFNFDYDDSENDNYNVFDNDDDDDNDDDSSDEVKLPTENGGLRATQLVIRSENLPSARALGPNQTWTCPEPDCGFVVRAAHEEKGQKLIGTHYEEHEKEARDMAPEMALDRVNLAVQEARGHMPINYLLEKIRNLNEKFPGSDVAHLNGQPVPQRIKRTLPI